MGQAGDVSPADQSKDGNSKRQQSQDNARDCQSKGVQPIEKKEQDQTPGRDRIRESHFPSPLRV
jgi:hypothetical protein